MIRARVTDPSGSPWLRRGLFAASLVAVVYVLFFRMLGVDWLEPIEAPLRESAMQWMLVALASTTLGALLPRLPSTNARISLRPGGIRLHGLTWRRRIRTKDVVGGTTARVGNKVLLTLSIGKQPTPPVTLELDSEDDAHRIREALAIGHHGFGTVLWPVGPTNVHVIHRLAGAVIVLVPFMYFIQRVLDLPLPTDVVMIYAPMAYVASFVAVWHGMSTLPYVALRAEGLYLFRGALPQRIPYAAITSIERHGSKLVVHGHGAGHTELSTSYFPEAPSEEAIDHVMTHIRAASERARGGGPEEVAVHGFVDILRRLPEEDVRTWLARVEAAAPALEATGYRHAGITEPDLWTIYEDPDADAELRLAAGRVLGRVVAASEPRERLRVIAAATRDETQAQRLRVALDGDLEELAFLIDGRPLPQRPIRRRST